MIRTVFCLLGMFVCCMFLWLFVCIFCLGRFVCLFEFVFVCICLLWEFLFVYLSLFCLGLGVCDWVVGLTSTLSILSSKQCRYCFLFLKPLRHLHKTCDTNSSLHLNSCITTISIILCSRPIVFNQTVNIKPILVSGIQHHLQPRYFLVLAEVEAKSASQTEPTKFQHVFWKLGFLFGQYRLNKKKRKTW